MRKILLPTSISLLFLLNPTFSLANINIEAAEKNIQEKRNHWLDNIKHNIITHSPLENSKIALWDRLISHEYTQITDERQKRAQADKSQDPNYVFSTFNTILFGKHNADLTKNNQYHTIKNLYDTSTRADDQNRQRVRSIDFILKDYFQRGRPYQVLDKEGHYIADYTKIRGSSFPSGHTWNGFKQAAVLAILFPEKGREIYARAIEYGESRVIAGAHFPTDTIASRVGHYYLLSQLLADDEITQSFVVLAKNIRKEIAPSCQMDIKNCLNTPMNIINDETGYYGKKGTGEKGLITPNELPHTAAHLLRLRFAYLNKEQWQGILASTAYPMHSLAGWNVKKNKPDSYWGLINLPKAYLGPAYLYDNVVINQTTNKFDFAKFGEIDEWKNNISGPGKLIKNGDGTLVLSGKNNFAGLDINQGSLWLTGENKYTQNASINGGTLIVSGDLNSSLDVNKGTLALNNGNLNATVNINHTGLLTGHGKISHLTVNRGGTVSPESLSDKLIIKDSLTFNSGSQYHININPKNASTNLSSQGTATLNGGIVNVSLEKSPNLLTQKDVTNLFNSKYPILNATHGITGQFEGIAPNYLFIGTTLTYAPNTVTLHVGRNNTPFASVANTQNQKKIAYAIDKLPSSNTLYKSVLSSNTLSEARHIFHNITGQIHADVLSNHINNSRHVREILVEQMRQSRSLNHSKDPNDNKGNVWAKILHGWDDASSDGNATHYNASTYGVLLGADQYFYHDKVLLGLAAGFTKSALSGHHSHGNSDNYHLSAYSGFGYNNIRFRISAGQFWHQINTSKTVNYQVQSESHHAKYNGSTHQAFIEAAYPLKVATMHIEPFASLAYTNIKNDAFKERGGPASLQAKKQGMDATTSMLGIRLDKQWAINTNSLLNAYGELGWQHQYNSLERGLAFQFVKTDPTFTSNSVNAPRDAMMIKIGTRLNLNGYSKLSIGYNGLISNNQKNHSIDTNISISF